MGPCDVTKKEDLENLVKEISKKEKYINVLVCNAGISGPKAEPVSEKATELKEALFEGESFEEWKETFNTNVSGVYVSLDLFYSEVSDLSCIEKVEGLKDADVDVDVDFYSSQQ